MEPTGRACLSNLGALRGPKAARAFLQSQVHSGGSVCPHPATLASQQPSLTSGGQAGFATSPQGDPRICAGC